MEGRNKRTRANVFDHIEERAKLLLRVKLPWAPNPRTVASAVSIAEAMHARHLKAHPHFYLRSICSSTQIYGIYLMKCLKYHLRVRLPKSFDFFFAKNIRKSRIFVLLRRRESQLTSSSVIHKSLPHRAA